MPTQNPRLSVTLTPEVAAVLRQLSDLTGNSQSATVGELLQMTVPIFERVVAGIRAAKELEAGAKAEILDGLERAQAKVEEQLGIALSDMDEGFRPLLEHAEKVQRRASGGRRAGSASRRPPAERSGSTPVPVTRGSGHPPGGTRGKKRGRGGRL